MCRRRTFDGDFSAHSFIHALLQGLCWVIRGLNGQLWGLLGLPEGTIRAEKDS